MKHNTERNPRVVLISCGVGVLILFCSCTTKKDKNSECHSVVNGDYQGSKAACLKQCEAGKLESCIDLANSLRDKNYGKIDEEKAIHYYRKACMGLAAGKASDTLQLGCFYLGSMLEKKGDPKSIKQAVKYYKVACDKGMGVCCHAIAKIYSQSLEGSKDAKKYFQKACDLNYVQACPK